MSVEIPKLSVQCFQTFKEDVHNELPFALGRGNWTFLGSDRGGRDYGHIAEFRSSCELVKIDPFAWFRDVLSRIASHSIQNFDQILPHSWAAPQA